MQKVRYAWCTYRTWSFEVLEGLLGHPNAECAVILTTPDCKHDFSWFESKGIPILRADPKKSLLPGSDFLSHLNDEGISCSFFYGWSWIIPSSFHKTHFSVTLHPGKLPDDKGGSPLQNQIRNGSTSSYANIIAIDDDLDAGPIFMRKEFSLAGDISDVWLRMVSSGVALTREFLMDVESSKKSPLPNSKDGTIFKRVKPADSWINPKKQTAQTIYNIIRAHNETDPNTYVRRARLNWNNWEMIFVSSNFRSQGIVHFLAEETPETIFQTIHKVNNGEACLSLRCEDGMDLYITQLLIRT